MATKRRSSKRKSTKKTQKNSLVANINRRKRAGKSRPKFRSTIAKGAYRDMQQGWPNSKRARKPNGGSERVH